MADATTIENGAGGGKSRFATVGGVVALAALVYGGYRLWQARQPYEWSGTVEARTITVGSRAGGRIAKILVREGDRVKGGQALLELEPGDIMAQQLQAQGLLDQSQANLDKLVKGARPEEIEEASARAKTATAALAETKTGARREQILGAQARLKAQSVALEKAELDANRYRQLFARGAAARAELDNVESALQSALATRDALKQSLEELTNGSRAEDVDQAMARAAEARASERLIKAGSRVEDIKAARGEVEAAQGKLDAIKTLVDELIVKAPRDARVESLDLRPGDLWRRARRRRRSWKTTSSTCASTCRRRSSAICIRARRCRSPSTASRASRSKASSSTSTPSANIRRATCRPPTSAPTKCSPPASACATAKTSCAPAWRRSFRWPNDHRGGPELR